MNLNRGPAKTAAFAIGAHHAFIYIRGEFDYPARQMRKAMDQAYKKGFLGKNILGTGYDLDMIVHTGGGAYICGEETALLNSLEGKPGQTRIRPPFPAVEGLYACPTVVNNVETLSNVSLIKRRRLVCLHRHPEIYRDKDILPLRACQKTGQL